MDAAGFAALAERITTGLIDGDFDTYASAFRLPVRMVPRDGDPYDLADRDALHEDWALYRQAIRIQRVTDIDRRVVNIMHVEDDWIEVLAETNMLRGAERVVDPFNVQFVLRPAGGEWRIAMIRSSVGHINWTLGRADIVDTKFHPRTAHEED